MKASGSNLELILIFDVQGLISICATTPSPACPECGAGLVARQSISLSLLIATWKTNFKGY